MSGSTLIEGREFTSGEIVEPGYYVDLETGAVVQIREVDELPDGSRTIQYRRRFRQVPAERVKIATR